MKQNLTDDKRVITKLKKYQKIIRAVAKNSTVSKTKIKRISSAKGGFMLGAILPIVASLLSKVIL